jgi:DNA-directed RNA polymerase II subunit RPB2
MTSETPPAFLPSLDGDTGRTISRAILNRYFKTTENFLTRHNIDSFDQFLKTDMISIIRSLNPFLLVKDKQEDNTYNYEVKVFIGGETGDKIKIGVPTLILQGGNEIRALLPNEARLRNLTYQASITADILIRVTYGPNVEGFDENESRVVDQYITDFPLFAIPILLHSRYCILHGKPAEFLRQAGECPNDQGGYFIVDGSEKVLITVQEQAFNTLYVKREQNATTSPKVHTYASILCLSAKTREVKRVSFQYMRKEKTIRVGLPFLRLPVPLFVLFRALGLTSDREIMRSIFPDENAEDTKLLEPLLVPSMVEAYPFLDTYSAVAYMKTFTKGYSMEHVIDILDNQTFIHVSNRPLARAHYLGECVRQILRNVVGIDRDTDRDDTRNQRALPAGFMIQQLFQGIYKSWKSSVIRAIEYKYNPHKDTLYKGKEFQQLFVPTNYADFFRGSQMTEMIRRGFKGKWGGSYGEEKDGALQALSRLSYFDFLSHCRRVVLNFDTTMKLQPPRRLHGSQFGYFCTSETPGGASIGITKNLSLLTAISTATNPEPFEEWLFTRGGVYKCNEVSLDSLAALVPVYINGGIVGYTDTPEELTDVLKLFKWTGCLPAYTSVGFSYRERRIFIYMDDGRPMRPLIHLKDYKIPVMELESLLRDPGAKWTTFIQGTSNIKKDISEPGFFDPLATEVSPSLDRYKTFLTTTVQPGIIEYVDPYEQNEAYIATFPDYVKEGTTFSHLEIHPSTIVSIMTGQIPFANHNQSPRNQLSCSQSKQAVSLYATNFQNRYDNTANILCYGQAPLVRTIYYDYIADGNMPYGNNIILAIGCYTGYNRDDGILFNADSFQRGLFRSINYRSYEGIEEDDETTRTTTRISHPKDKPTWFNLKPGLDYSKLDENGIVRIGQIVDENTVIVSRYVETRDGEVNDASVTPQVWTGGRVESVVVTMNNKGLRTVKVRITHDRMPELGDKFSNRHGQKGTIGMMIRAHDMPRTKDGLVPDMIMNPHAIPSRMTVAQLLETLLGKLSGTAGAIGNGTMFMNDGDPSIAIGKQLTDYGFERQGNDILYNGQTGTMMPTEIFMGPCYTMRLKHMVADKWNARGLGRRERRTHQPTGGRGNQGGLRIGELERDAMIAHGISGFIRESYMKRSDGTEMIVCNGCGTVPIYNERQKLYICPLCDGPVQFGGSEREKTLTLLPVNKRSYNTFSRIEIPYVLQLLNDELQTYANMGMRYITSKYGTKFVLPEGIEINDEEALRRMAEPIPVREFEDVGVPGLEEPEEPAKPLDKEVLTALGIAAESGEEEEEEAAPGAVVSIPKGANVVVVPPGAEVQTKGVATVFRNVSALQTGDLGAAAAGLEETLAGQQATAQAQGQPVVVGTAVASVPVSVPVAVPVVANAPSNTGSEEESPAAGPPPATTVRPPSTVAGVPTAEATPTPPAAPVLVTPAGLPGLPTGVQATGPLILQQGGGFGGFGNPFGGALMYTTGIPQAPATFVVDTSESAMAMDGIQQSAPAPRSRSPSRRPSPSSSSSQDARPAPSGNVKVTIIKQGAP